MYLGNIPDFSFFDGIQLSLTSQFFFQHTIKRVLRMKPQETGFLELCFTVITDRLIPEY